MRLTADETRALAFVAFLLALAAGARVAERGPAFAPDAPTLDLAALEQASVQALDAEARRSKPLAPGERIDPNTAPPEELDRLPGIGPSLAQRIVAERERGGPFRSAADLVRVPGIGERSIARLAPLLSVPASARAPAASAARHPPGSVLIPAATADTPSPDRRGAAGSAGRRVDLNHANAAVLERVPGIGPVLAARIVAFRDSAGPFRTLDDLERVPGIGPATLARLKPHLRLTP